MQPDPQLAPRVLLTLVDPLVRRSVDQSLRSRGFSVRATTDPVAAEVLVRSYEPEIVVVDLSLMGPDGTPVYRRVRRHQDLYLVVHDVPRDERVTVLQAGADDVVSDDVSPDEITARCEVLLRRPRRLKPRWDPLGASLIRLGPLVVDLGRREVRVKGQTIPVTRLEFDLFAHLCRHPQEVRSRAQLLEAVWGPGWVGDTHVVDVHLSNLRRKLQARASDLRFIHTVRGVGFRLSDDLLRVAAEDLVDSGAEMIRPA